MRIQSHKRDSSFVDLNASADFRNRLGDTQIPLLVTNAISEIGKYQRERGNDDN